MKRIKISLQYENKTFSSNEREVSDDEIQKVKDFLNKVAQGQIINLCIENNGMYYYFPKNIIDNSIITLDVW